MLRTAIRVIIVVLLLLPCLCVLAAWIRSASIHDLLIEGSRVAIWPDGRRSIVKHEDVWSLLEKGDPVLLQLRKYTFMSGRGLLYVQMFRLECAAGGGRARSEAIDFVQGLGFPRAIWADDPVADYRDSTDLTEIGQDSASSLYYRIAASESGPRWGFDYAGFSEKTEFPASYAPSAQFGQSVPGFGATTVWIRRYAIVVPYYALFLASFPWPLWLLWRICRRWRRRRLGLCLKCGYDLRASKDRCPECGHPILKQC